MARRSCTSSHAPVSEARVRPAILEEYTDVLDDHPEFAAEIVACFPLCYPLTELSVIRHALAANMHFILTVNTAPRALRSEAVSGGQRAWPGEFLNVPEVGRMLKKLIRA